MLQNVFKKTYTKIDRKIKKISEPNVPEGLWKKCRKCGKPIYAEDVRSNFYVCPKCGGYFRIHAYRRIEILADPETFEEWDQHMEFKNPLDFPGYEEKVFEAQKKTRLDEAVVTGKAKIHGTAFAVCVCDARFLMSSMGYNVGEKITRAVERATKEGLPVICFACSGGARMQEGMISLMQMAKTSAALKKHHEAGLLYITVLTDPTTGGVTASFAMLGDIIIAEPGALIGFAGPRVIAQTIGQKLPEGFQRAEFLLSHGFIDRIVERKDQRDELGKILKMHEKECKSGISDEDIHKLSTKNVDNNKKFEKKAKKCNDPWETVLISRQAGRPTAMDYVELLFNDFIEFHGDRYYGDDGAVAGGIAEFFGMPVTVICQQKGRNTKDNLKRNFGMPSPEGYRKALRLMKQAEKFHRPVICFVDTPGAYCGIEAEERGQGEAIARNLFEMADLKVPVLSVVTGEGGSGGALAMAVANEVWMLENSIYSILSPEGFASILYKDSKRAPEAAGVMKITAADLYERGLIEKVIPEYGGVCKENLPEVADIMKQEIGRFILNYMDKSGEETAEERISRFRRF